MKKTVLLFALCLGILGAYAQYCPYAGDCGDQLLLVDINGYVNNSGTCDFYTDYTGTVPMYAEPGSNFMVNVAWQTFSDAAVYLFFDWDENEVWDPATEMYVLGTGAATNASTQVVVPPTVASGAVVKVRAMLAFMYEAPDPCTGPPAGVFSVSEVEDYTLEILDELPIAPGYCDARGFSNGDRCRVSGAGTETNMWISNVELTGKFTNRSDSCGIDNGYSDFTNIIAEVAAGETLSGIVETLPTAGSAYHLATMWIDWNADRVFDDATERYDLPKDDGISRYLINVIVPPTAVEGVTRMRVRASDKLFVNDVNLPCGTTNRGEVEDYTIFVGNLPPNCAENYMPQDGTTDLCLNGIELTWDAPSDGEAPDGYKLSLGTDNPPTTIEDNTDLGNVTSYTISEDLEPGTTYFWTVTPYSDENGDAFNCVVNSFTTADGGNPNVKILDEDGQPITEVVACTGVELPLQSEVSDGTGAYEYEWTGDDLSFLSDLSSDATVFNSPNSGNNSYTLSVSDENGCSGSATLSVSVETNANAGTIAGNTEVCSGEDLVLTATGTQGDLQWQQISDGVWVDISDANQSTYSTPSAQAGSQYRLIASTANCADTSVVLNITVFPKPESPEITTSNGLEGFCQGEELTLSSNQINNNWSTGSTDASIIVTDAGSYSVTYVDGNGCESEATNIEIAEFPVPDKPIIDQVENGGEIYACGGYPFELTTSNNAEFDISWIGLNGETEASASATEDGEVQLTFTNEFGCSTSSDLANVQEKPLPSTPIITTEDNSTAFCEGETLDLTAQTDAGTSLVWNDDAGITGSSISVEEGGEYFVTATDAFGCVAQSESITITENPLPEVPTLITPDGSTEFCDNESPYVTTETNNVYWNGDVSNTVDTLFIDEDMTVFATAVTQAGCERASESIDLTVHVAPEIPSITNDNGTLLSSVNDLDFVYQWFSQDGTEIQGENEPVFTNAPEGTYYIVVTDPGTGCASQSDIVNDIQQLGAFNTLKVFPNPVERGATVSIVGAKRIGKVRVLDASGRQVLAAEGGDLNTSGLSKGLYVLQIEMDGLEAPVISQLVVQ